MMIQSLFIAFIAFVSVVTAQTYSFCSTASSNVVAPSLPWSVQTIATLQLTSTANGLYRITNATGYRVLKTRGQTYNQTITSISSLDTYHHNDNLISITMPYLTDSHSFAFLFGSRVEQVYFTSSESNILFKNASGNITENDLPWNDGVINQITSSMSLVQGSTASCPALPDYPISATALAAFNNHIQIPFCYSFSGGPGDGSPDQTLWTVTASGAFTVAGLAGNSSNGGQTHIVLGVSGDRSYVDEYYNVVSRFLYVSPSSGAISTKYPNFDLRGLSMMFDSSLFYWNGNTSSRLATIFVDSSTMFNELLGPTQTIQNVVGNIDIQPPGDTQQLQCGFEDGSLTSYQYCYSLSAPTGDAWKVSAYGQFTATGPVIRKDYLALTMQSMTGIRVVTNSTGSYTQNIIKLVYINGANVSSGSNILNDNLIFVNTAIPVDYYGFVYTLSTPAIFPSLVSSNGDINLSAGSSKWYEWPVADNSDGVSTPLEKAYFNFTTTASRGEDYFPCDSSVRTFPMKKFYFCYQIATSDYTIRASGMILTYGAEVPFGGRTGYGIANITGYRSFTRNGVTSYSTIISSNSDSWGAINNTYSKILYPTAPHLDSLGVVINVDNDAQTPVGNVIGEHIFDISMDSNGNLTEIAYTTGGSYSGVGWMTITDDESKIACRVDPSNLNSANGVVSSFMVTMTLVLIVALIQ